MRAAHAPPASALSAMPARVWMCADRFPVNSSHYNWLPQSPYNIWDIVVKDQDGKDLTVPWKCSQSGGITLDCDWKGSSGEKGISMAFPSSAADSEEHRSADGTDVKAPAEIAPGSSLAL